MKRRNERSNGYWRGEEEGKKERERDDDMRERVSVLRVLQGHLIKIYFFLFLFLFCLNIRVGKTSLKWREENIQYTIDKKTNE